MPGRPACDVSVNAAGPFARVPLVNAFHVCGVLFAAWALIISILGIRRERFPVTGGAARAAGAISIVLCLAAIGTAIYTSATEEHESEEEGEEQALLLRF